MSTTGAASGGIGAIVLGLILLGYQIGRWRGGDPTPQIHFYAGLSIAALLFLGGGVLGAVGGATAAFGNGVGTFALESGVDVAASGGPKGPVTGGEQVAVGGAAIGLIAVAVYAGLIKSGRYDLRSPVLRGGLCGVWLGAGGGLIGMAIGLIRTSGNTLGQVLINTL
jgi:hypothetical protein